VGVPNWRGFGRLAGVWVMGGVGPRVWEGEAVGGWRIGYNDEGICRNASNILN